MRIENNKLIAFDIETRAHENTDEYLDKYKEYKAPSNYKNQDAIDGYISKAKAKDRDKAALYIPTQRIWVICLEHIDTNERIQFESKDERVVVEEFFEYLDSYPNHSLFGFNSRGFDFPVLYGAALRTSTLVPVQLKDRNLQLDILDDFYHTKIKLQDLAHVMQSSKTMEGSEVGQSWLSYALEGNTKARDEVIHYCVQDTHLCAEYVRRVYG